VVAWMLSNAHVHVRVVHSHLRIKYSGIGTGRKVAGDILSILAAPPDILRSAPTFGTTFVDFPGGSWSPYVALSYDVIPSRFNLAFEYDHDLIGDEIQRGATNGAWINQFLHLYAVHFRLLF
jgi:hypothetical protein